MLLRRTLPSTSTRTRVGIAAGVARALVILLLARPDGTSEAGGRTAPNATVFASGRLTVAPVVRAGAGLDV